MTHPPASAGGRHRSSLVAAFALTSTYMIAEIVGGIVTGSLALLSDAAHMGTDVLGIGMALAAVFLASKPPTARRTYGTYRLEVLAALANAVLLFGVGIYILFEAFGRLREPPQIPGIPVLIVAVVGLIVNLVSFRLLRHGATESLNVKGAYLEVISDLLGSIGVIAAGVIIYLTGWYYADPIFAAGIGLFILPRAYRLGAEAVRVLLEIAPPTIDVDDLRTAMKAVPGVEEIHDLHVWTLTSGIEAASAHIVVGATSDAPTTVRQVTDLLKNDYGIGHATIQAEPADHREDDMPV